MQGTMLTDGIADMVALIGHPEFGSRFFGIAEEMLGADHCTVFVSQGDGVKTLVAEAQDDVAARRVRDLANCYSERGFRNDPVWNRRDVQFCGSRACPDVLAPGDFSDPGYRREFYDKPNILEELALSAQFEDGMRVYLSFYRERGRARFTSEEVSAVQQSAPITLRILAKHAEICARTAPQAPRLSREERYARVHQAILDDNRLLTNREAEVCTGIVLGYTVLGLSLNMGISVNTVATHRKRAYSKLNISSQNELFAHYFTLVEGLN